MKVFAYISEIAKKYPKQFAITIGLLLFLNLIEMLSVIMLAPLVDFITRPNLLNASVITIRLLEIIKMVGLPGNLYTIIALILAFSLLKCVVSLLINYSVLKIKYLLVKDVVCNTFHEFLGASWYFFVVNSQGVLGNTFIKETSKVGDSFGAMANMFVLFFQVVIYFALPLFVSWKLSLIIMALGVLIALPYSLLGKVFLKYGEINVKTANKIYEVIQETLATAKVIIGFGEQKKSVDLLGKAFDAHVNITIKSQVLEKNAPSIYQLFGLAIIMLCVVLSQKVFKGSLADSTVVLYSFYLAIPLLGQFVGCKNSILTFIPSYEQIKQLRLMAKKEVQLSGPIKFSGFTKSIDFKDVNYGYRGQEILLKNINLSIPKGKMVAFVGKSGAGKSTLVDILLGFYRPESGTIRVDSTDLNEIDILSWRHRIGYVPQDCILFNMSIRDNLKWANDQATREDIAWACKMANVDEFISQLPKGVDTIVGDRGVRLSGGQRQRVALARAILRKPELLILDEATSSLDSHSERLIQEAIENIANETTVVVVAHRLSTIINADCICVIDDGYIVEKGAFVELQANKGKCYELAKMQGIA